MTRGLIVLISILIYGCHGADINDPEKKNENWAYWVDSLTGEASWISVADQTTVNDGRYTLFYTKGATYQKGKLRNGKNIDTIYCFDLNENIIKFILIKLDTVIQYYIKDGHYTAYFQNGTVFEKGIVKNHDRGSEWTRYFENGNIEWVEKLDGYKCLTVSYHDNGQMRDSIYHINGKAHGRIKHWYKNGQIEEVSDWDNGIQNGIYETYHENGKPKQKALWINGKREGKADSWYNSGQQEILHFYKNGLLEGGIKEWYPNGNLKRIANYVNGQIDGKTTEYHENGKVRGEGLCDNGKQVGIWLWYYDNGKLNEKDTYVNGQLVNVEK